MAKHALLSASGAHRWLECTPSAKLESQFENKSSAYAEEGTAAHSLAELVTKYWLGMLADDKSENERIYEEKLDEFKKTNKYYTASMLEHAVSYAKLISESLEESLQTCRDTFTELEVKVDFSKYVPQGFGTADCIIVSDNILEIIDFKYGKGHRVDAEGNPQMRLYAIGAIEAYKDLYDIEKVRMTIFQPRIFGAQSSDEISVAELFGWAEEYVKPRAALAIKGKGKFAPSAETCKFCRAKEACRARTEHNIKLFDEAPDILCITPEEAGQLLNKADDITSWIEDLKTLVSETLLERKLVSGWKMVEGKSNRKYKDDKEVAKKLKEAGYADSDIYETKLLSITKLEDSIGAKELAKILKGLIVKPEGKPTLAPESDKRKTYQIKEKILSEFDSE